MKTALIAGCGLPRLMKIQSDLYDAAYRYRRIMCQGRLTVEGVYEGHQTLAELVLARDLEAASNELERHLLTSLRVVYGDNA